MRNIRQSIQDKLDGGTVALLFCARIVPVDGDVLYMADYPQNVTLGGNVYRSTVGFNSSAVNSNASLSPDSLDVQFILGTVGVAKADIEAGKYDGAEVLTFLTDADDPIEDDIKLTRGFFGKAKIKDNTIECEFISLIAKLDQQVGEQTSPKCRAELGDGRCGVRLDPPLWTANTEVQPTIGEDARVGAIVQPSTPNGYYFECQAAGTTGASEPAWVVAGAGDTVGDNGVAWVAIRAYRLSKTVASATDRRHFITAGSGREDGHWNGGIATFTSGLNAGYSKEIKTQTGNTFELYDAMPFAIAANDTVTLQAGCHKRLIEDCVGKYSNRYNYRGEPYIPTQVEAFKFGGQ